MFTRARQWYVSWTRWIQSTPAYPVSLKNILVLFSHIRLDPSSLGLQTKILHTFLFPVMPCSPHKSWSHRPNNIQWRGWSCPCAFLTWAPHHEDVLEEWSYNCTQSLTSAGDGGEWSASRPSRFTPIGRAPGTHWTGGWVGPRAGLDAVVRR